MWLLKKIENQNQKKNIILKLDFLSLLFCYNYCIKYYVIDQLPTKKTEFQVFYFKDIGTEI